MFSLANVPIHPHKSLHWPITIRSKRRNQSSLILFFLILWGCLSLTQGEALAQTDSTRIQQDTVKNLPYKSSRKPTFKLKDRYGDPFSSPGSKSPLFLKDPTKLTFDVNYDSAVSYTVYEKIGGLDLRHATQLSFEDFKGFQQRE